jgi:hypothetical protein
LRCSRMFSNHGSRKGMNDVAERVWKRHFACKI